MKFILKILVPFLLGMVVAVFGVYSINNLQIFSKGETSVTNVTIKAAFDDIAELATESYTFAGVGRFTQEEAQVMGLSIPFTGKSLEIAYEGAIKAGIRDLTAAQVDMNDVTHAITITLPDVEILDAYLDSESYEVLNDTSTIFNHITAEETTKLLDSELQTQKSAASTNGILDKARTHAESVVLSYTRALVAGTDMANATITVKWR